MYLSTLVLCLCVCVPVSLACYPSVRHDQQTFCDSRYVFVGVVQRTIDLRSERVFLVTVQSNLRGTVGYPGSSIFVFGFGRQNSCGPTVLQNGQRYILYGSNDVLEPRKISLVHHEFLSTYNINKLRNYDCSCKIAIGNRRLSDLNPVNIQVPQNGVSPRDQCIVVHDSWSCAFRTGFCARRLTPYGRICTYQVPLSNCVDRNLA